jgi:hypothetical protein
VISSGKHRDASKRHDNQRPRVTRVVAHVAIPSPPNCREKSLFARRCGELAVLSDSILRGARFISSKFSTIRRQTDLAR